MAIVDVVLLFADTSVGGNNNVLDVIDARAELPLALFATRFIIYPLPRCSPDNT